MLGDMLGVPVSSHGTLAQAWEILQGLPGSNLPTLALSALVAGSILLGKRFAPRIPLSLFAVAGTIGASAVFHFAERGIAVIGPVPGGLPAIGLPYVTWSEALTLLPVAASGVVMIIAQSAATSQAFALRYHERVSDGLFQPSMNAIIANAAPADAQGRVQGANQSQQALARMLGPLLAAVLSPLGASAPRRRRLHIDGAETDGPDYRSGEP